MFTSDINETEQNKQQQKESEPNKEDIPSLRNVAKDSFPGIGCK